MAIRSGLTLSTRCANCHQNVLRAFISSLSSPTVKTSTRPRRVTRRFGTSATERHNSSNNETNESSDFEGYHTLQQTSSGSLDRNASHPAPPWYLQVKEQQDFQHAPENPFAERQIIPELPHDPPPMLESLLKHISVDIGLDYLTLLDLRRLDPPPALGNNLFMIFGTARSEKHLNVSADRLCRWLRTTYRLRPVADGLLGRNELKLKLRRKNRRSKMLGAAGAIDPGNFDDGIHTGWICINVGAVEGPVQQTNVTLDALDDGFVGFGQEDERPKIVIQLMTEEKRGEVELENLWEAALDRSLRRQEAQSKSAGELDHTVTETEESMEAASSRTRSGHLAENNSSSASTKSFLQRSIPPGGQVRSIHTTRYLPALAEKPDDYELEPHLLHNKTNPTISSHNTASFPVPPRLGKADLRKLRFDGSARALQASLDFLYKQETRIALRELGRDEYDRSSTSFLSTFYSNLPVFLEEHHWRCIADLHMYALKIGHSGYTRPGLLNLMRKMHGSLSTIPEDLMMEIFTALLHNKIVVYPASKDGSNRPSTPEQALRQSLALAFEVLEKMDGYGYNICSDKVFLALHHAISYPHFVADVHLPSGLLQPAMAKISSSNHEVSTSSTLAFPRIAQDRYNYHLRQAMKILNPGPLSHSVYSALLKTYATQEQWHSFWSVWRDMPRQMVNRTTDMYITAFRASAAANSQRFAQRTMKEIVPQMAQEDPPVELKDKLAVAVGECLQVARFDASEPFRIALSKSLELALSDHLLQQWAEGDKPGLASHEQDSEKDERHVEGEAHSLS